MNIHHAKGLKKEKKKKGPNLSEYNDNKGMTEIITTLKLLK